MKSIYVNVAKKYEDIVKNIVTDNDLDHIDFPLIAVNFNVEPLAKLLPPQLVEKLGGLEDDEDSPEQEREKQINSGEKKEEFKEGELEDIKNASKNTTKMSTEEGEQQSQTLTDQLDNMNLADTTDQAGHLQPQNAGDGGSGTSSFAGVSEGQIDESCIGDSPKIKEKKMQNEEAMRPRHLQVPNATSKLRGIGIVN